MTPVTENIARNNSATGPLYNKIYGYSGRLMVERTLPYFAAVVFWTVFLLPSASAAPGRDGTVFAALA